MQRRPKKESEENPAEGTHAPIDSQAEDTIRSMLTGGDRRSIGRADQAVELVRKSPKQAVQLVACLWDRDACVRMRAADALEKVSREGAQLLQPYKPALLDLLAETTQQELRWHLALIVPRVRLNVSESRRAAEILESYLEDRSSIVKTFAMQGLVDLALQFNGLRPQVEELIHLLTRTGTPAMRARGRILLKGFSTAPRQ